MTVPQAAIDAVLAATRERCGCEPFHEYDCYLGQLDSEDAAALLEAAAPHIAAAERESIRQLALRKRAVYCLACDGAPCGYDDILRPFADLLTEDDPDSLTDPALD